MKLFFAPGTCSLSPRIVLEEIGLKYEAVKVDIKQKVTSTGEDYRLINPKGYVPALQIEPGEVLTEGPAIVQYLADHSPQSHLAPPAGTMERYRLVEWLSFISTELHKQFSPLFSPLTPDAYKGILQQKLQGRFQFLNEQLAAKDYLMGKDFSVADAYLFTVMRWSKAFKMNLEELPNLQAYLQRVGARPSVEAAVKAEI